VNETNRGGSRLFYKLLERMADLHEAKSHDYAHDSNPYGNYHFAGAVAGLFSHSPNDAGFAGRLAEKIFRLSVLGSGGKTPKNESIADTELDIAVISVLWMANRQELRALQLNQTEPTNESNQYRIPMIHGPEVPNGFTASESAGESRGSGAYDHKGEKAIKKILEVSDDLSVSAITQLMDYFTRLKSDKITQASEHRKSENPSQMPSGVPGMGRV
jgi:hypothetical protein